MQASNSTMYYTNPFSLYNKDVQPTDEGYNNKYAYWQKAYHDLRDELLHPELVFTPLLTDLGILDEVWDPLHLECALYATASGLQCNGKITESLWDFIPMDELLALYECYNFRFYASKGPDTLFQKGRQWAFAWTTMQDILDKADEDMSSGACPVRLRFGHDIIVMSLLALLDVDELGLDKTDRSILTCMMDKFSGGPVGLDNLAATTGEDPVTIEDVYEPYLMQLGFIMRTPRGRLCTPSAWAHMKKNMPAAAEAQIRMEI